MALLICLVIVICAVNYLINNTSLGKAAPAKGSLFTLYIIDVGQGDAAFIDNGDKDILIDAGPDSSSDRLLRYLDSIDAGDIEYAFFSHPHEDHIGGADEVIDRYNINNIVMPYVEHDNQYTNDLKASAQKRGSQISCASYGDVYNIGDAKFEILSPDDKSTYNNMNNYSLVIRITYGDVTYLFTGDAEKKNEKQMLEVCPDKLDCDVLKVGHHGSATSSCKEFLSAVTPELALISVGEGNRYGHPDINTLTNLKKFTNQIYRTDRDGTIIIGCNAKTAWYVNNK